MTVTPSFFLKKSLCVCVWGGGGTDDLTRGKSNRVNLQKNLLLATEY